VKTPYF